MIGSHRVGMGHIYRTMALADELKDYEIFFLSDTKSDLAISYFSGAPGWLGAFSEGEIVNQIISCKPDLVIFDVLDTDEGEIVALRGKGFLVVSFEDLGSEDSDETDELEDVPAEMKTKEGYLKDGFVVPDNNILDDVVEEAETEEDELDVDEEAEVEFDGDALSHSHSDSDSDSDEDSELSEEDYYYSD